MSIDCKTTFVGMLDGILGLVEPRIHVGIHILGINPTEKTVEVEIQMEYEKMRSMFADRYMQTSMGISHRDFDLLFFGLKLIEIYDNTDYIVTMNIPNIPNTPFNCKVNCKYIYTEMVYYDESGTIKT